MQTLSLTFETLAASGNDSATDVLIAALDDSSTMVRRLAIGALLTKTNPRSPLLLLANWGKLTPDELTMLRPKKRWMAETIDLTLREGGELLLNAIKASEDLGLTSSLQRLILLAESNASRLIRTRASEAVVTLVEPLGRGAREQHDQASVRGPVLARLTDSVCRFSMHRNEQLVEAFLLASTWGDGHLRQLISENGGPLDLICSRFAKSEHPGVIDLLTGFIRCRSIAPRIIEVMQTRADERFRDSLLQKVGHERSITVLRNLSDMGMPKSCLGGEASLRNLAAENRAAMVHLYGAAAADNLELLHLIATAVELGGPQCEHAAATEFSRCEVPDASFWMRAAVPVANGDEKAIACDNNARLLKRLIDLLDHSDPVLVRGVRRVLAPLHADAMINKFQSLRPRSRRRLGRVVMMIDQDAIGRVRDALRHPVLSHRLKAIAMADALAMVDLLSDSFAHISREDHQEARMLAADVMSDACGDETLKLLQEMMELPESPVRDAAARALDRRQTPSVR